MYGGGERVGRVRGCVVRMGEWGRVMRRGVEMFVEAIAGVYR